MSDITDINIHYVKSVDDLMEFKRWLSQDRPWLAVDTETDGLRWWDGRVRLAQVGDAQTGWCFDWEWWSGAVREGLSQYEGPIVLHNAKFDLHFLEQAGLDLTKKWPQIHDSMIMTALVASNELAGLKPTTMRLIDRRLGAGEKALKAAMADGKWDWDTVPVDLPVYWFYGGLDTCLTARLAEILWPEIEENYDDLYELERSTMVALYAMEKRGAHIDLAYVDRKAEQLAAEKLQLSSFLKETYAVGPGSPASVRDFLLHSGVKLTERTESGNYATTSLVLNGLRAYTDNPDVPIVADAVLRHRHVSKTLSSYMGKFIDLADDNGHLHPSIKQMGARTGRMSVATPNLQALTRGPEVRDAFIPSNEDNQLLLIDYDQIEMRILYHFCRDPNLYTAIMSGDLHTATAQMVYGDPTITSDDPRRQPAKSSGFAKVYGAGIETFANTAGIPLDEARHFMELYSEAFPGVDPFLGKVQAIARQRLQSDGAGWVKTPAGRRQVANPDKVYTATNYLIQGTAADVLKQTIVRLYNAGLEEFMVVPVHDELVFDVPRDQMQDVVETCRQLMPVPAEEFGVPLTVGEDIVDRWGDKYRKNGETYRDEYLGTEDMA